MRTTEPFTAQEIIDAVPKLSASASMEMTNIILQMRLEAVAKELATQEEPPQDE